MISNIAGDIKNNIFEMIQGEAKVYWNRNVEKDDDKVERRCKKGRGRRTESE